MVLQVCILALKDGIQGTSGTFSYSSGKPKVGLDPSKSRCAAAMKDELADWAGRR